MLNDGYIRKQIPLVLEDAENGLTVLFRELLNEQYKEMKHLDKRVEKLEQKLETIAANNEVCQLLLTIPTGHKYQVLGYSVPQQCLQRLVI